MLNYDLFRQMTDYLLPQCIPDRYMGFEPYPISKHINNSADKEGFSFRADPNMAPGNYAVPACYYSDLYQHYVRDNVGTDQLGTWLKNEMAGIFREVETVVSASRPGIRENFSNPANIFINLVNTDANQEFLEGVPHREFMDLSITYRYFVRNLDNRTQDISITNEFAGRLGMDESQLYEAAIANTPRIFPFVTPWITDVVDEELREEMLRNIPSCGNMLVVTTPAGIHGPNALLYPEVLDAASEKLGGDAFIIPSSIYELIMVNAGHMDGEDIAGMVEAVNEEMVAPQERLSNAAYFYDARSKTLSPAVDTVVPLSESIHNIRPLPAPGPAASQQAQQAQRSPRM